MKAEANRYKALSILMPNGPAAYCVVQTGENLRLFYVEKGNELHDPIEEWDSVRDAEDMVKELKSDIVDSLEQWARKTLHTEKQPLSICSTDERLLAGYLGYRK